MDRVIKKGDYLDKIYEKNLDTGNYIIPISLDKYNDVFNDWDNAPFKKRDMDPDLADFLEDCSEDIPFKYGVDVCFYISQQGKDENREQALISGFKNYYYYYYMSETKFLKESYKKILKYIVMSFSFLIIIFLSTGVHKENILVSTVKEGILIGAWVFLWEAISFFFFKKVDVTEKIKKYKRFKECSIYFKYNNL